MRQLARRGLSKYAENYCNDLSVKSECETVGLEMLFCALFCA